MQRPPRTLGSSARRTSPARTTAQILGLTILLIVGLIGAAPTAASAAEPPTILRWWLVDADTDTRLIELTDYQRLILPVLPDHLSIEAEANGETESVSMRIEGVESALENNAPYALGSDTGGDFNPVLALTNPGWLTVSAQPFADHDGGGTSGLEAKLRLYLHEPTFVVTHPDDSGDTFPGDGRCIPTRIDDGFDLTASRQIPTSRLPTDELDLKAPRIDPGPCTLRAAIEEANALPGRQSILVLADRGPFVLEQGMLTIDDGVDLEGHGRAVVDADRRSRLFYLTGDHLVNVRSLDLTGGNPGSTARGGAIWVDNGTHLQMSDSIVRDSRANYGGGIYLQAGGDLTLRSSAIRDNIAGTPDDGIDGGGITQRGGGIYNLEGVVKIIDSSIADNLAVRGGGLSNKGGTMRVENSSVIDNEALAIGGGIENHDNGSSDATLHLAFATVANNQAGTSIAPPPDQRVGGGLHNTGRAFLASSILADNTDGWSAGDPLHAPDCHSPNPYDFTSYRNNVVGVLNGNCELADYGWGNTAWIQHGTEASPLDPGLNGPSVWGHLPYRNLTASSVALDGGASQTASLYPCAEHDMRGRARPVGGGCDIGAVERH